MVQSFARSLGLVHRMRQPRGHRRGHIRLVRTADRNGDEPDGRRLEATVSSRRGCVVSARWQAHLGAWTRRDALIAPKRSNWSRVVVGQWSSGVVAGDDRMAVKPRLSNGGDRGVTAVAQGTVGMSKTARPGMRGCTESGPRRRHNRSDAGRGTGPRRPSATRRPTRSEGGVFHSTVLMLSYQIGAFPGSAA
jgi:hypothetical protein